MRELDHCPPTYKTVFSTTVLRAKWKNQTPVGGAGAGRGAQLSRGFGGTGLTMESTAPGRGSLRSGDGQLSSLGPWKHRVSPEVATSSATAIFASFSFL